MVTGFPGGREVTNLPVNARDASSIKQSAHQCKRCRFHPWVGKIPWRRKWQSIPVFLPGESHGQRSLQSYSPWGHRTEHACTRMITQPSPRLCVCGNSGFVRSSSWGFLGHPGDQATSLPPLSGFSLFIPSIRGLSVASQAAPPPSQLCPSCPSEIWLGGLTDVSRGWSRMDSLTLVAVTTPAQVYLPSPPVLGCDFPPWLSLLCPHSPTRDPELPEKQHLNSMIMSGPLDNPC